MYDQERRGLKRLALAPRAVPLARSLRRRMTRAERVLWRALRRTLPEYHWRRQVPLGRYFADFASHSAKLIIELDGGQHAMSRVRDAHRTRFLEHEGFRVIRFWNNDVLANIDGVLSSIAGACSEASPLVGEVGGGPAASAAEMTSLLPSSAAADAAPPPNPPHEGEGSKVRA